MAKDKKGGATTATPVAPGTATAPVVKKAPPKTTMAQAKVLIAAGVITEEQLADMLKKGLVTDGTGGGEDVMEQFAKAGVPKADIDALKNALEKVNAALWKDAKTYIGTPVKHSFNKKNEDGSKTAYEADAQIEAALWCKHHEIVKPEAAK